MKTWIAKPGEVERKWWLVNAEGKKLGRLSTQIAGILRGKNKPSFSPHVDCGDFVVVVNADKVKMTGQKWENKKYYRHSGYFGSLKTKTAEQMRNETPEFLLQEAVKGMLPKNKLARRLIQKLKVFSGGEHTHAAQKPQALE